MERKGKNRDRAPLHLHGVSRKGGGEAEWDLFPLIRACGRKREGKERGKAIADGPSILDYGKKKKSKVFIRATCLFLSFSLERGEGEGRGEVSCYFIGYYREKEKKEMTSASGLSPATLAERNKGGEKREESRPR